MELSEIKRGLLNAIEKYNGKQVGVGQIRIDYMAHDCYNAIVKLEKDNARLRADLERVTAERDAAVAELKDTKSGRCFHWKMRDL